MEKNKSIWDVGKFFHKNIKPTETSKVNCIGDCGLIRDHKNLSLIPQLFVMRTHHFKP